MTNLDANNLLEIWAMRTVCPDRTPVEAAHEFARSYWRTARSITNCRPIADGRLIHDMCFKVRGGVNIYCCRFHEEDKTYRVYLVENAELIANLKRIWEQ